MSSINNNNEIKQALKNLQLTENSPITETTLQIVSDTLKHLSNTITIGSTEQLSELKNRINAIQTHAKSELQNEASPLLSKNFSLEVKNVCEKIQIQLRKKFLKDYNPTIINSLIQTIKTKKQLIKQENDIVSSLLDPKKKGAHIFAEVTRRIPPKKFAPLQKKLNESPNPSKEFLDSVEAGNWESLGNIPDYYLESLKALKEGLISKEVFATIQMYRTTIEFAGKSEVTIVPLFKKGEINSEALSKIRETLVLRDTNLYTPERFPSENLSYLTRIELQNFLKHMQSKHPLEQNLFLYTGPDLHKTTITYSITISTRLNVLFRCNNFIRMVPSFSMMQECINAKNGENAVRINPVIALSSIGDIASNGLNGTRDLALTIPGITLPETADGYEAIGPDFFLHDFYHAISCSSTLQEHRAFFVRVAFLMKKALSSFPESEQPEIKKFLERVIDMELSSYLSTQISKGSSTKSSDILWMQFGEFVQANRLIDTNKISDGSLKTLFSIIRDGLDREHLLLAGNPKQLSIDTMQSIKSYINMIAGLPTSEIDNILNSYESKLNVFDLTLPNNDQKNATITQFITDFWSKKIKPEYRPSLINMLVGLRTSPLYDLNKSNVWERPGDEKLYQERNKQSDFSSTNTTQTIDHLKSQFLKLPPLLNDYIKSYKLAPKTSKSEYDNFIRSKKEELDAFIIGLAPQPESGQKILETYYQSIKLNLEIQTPVAGSLEEKMLIEIVTNMVFTGIAPQDNNTGNLLAEAVFQYRLALCELETIPL